jgi:hypothetical protein
MTKIDETQSNRVGPTENRGDRQQKRGPGEGKTKFGKFMGKVADGALEAVSTVAPAIPGGQLVKMAADGLQKLRGKTPDGLMGPGGESEKLQQMMEMQEQNQVYNMQYLKLQEQAQADNRRFKTISNLMKVRHDTAKSAINNMRA